MGSPMNGQRSDAVRRRRNLKFSTLEGVDDVTRAAHQRFAKEHRWHDQQNQHQQGNQHGGSDAAATETSLQPIVAVIPRSR